MQPSLNLSFNELTALLRDVCKVTYGQDHDYVQIADTLVWMEVQGLSGLASVLEDHKTLRACPFNQVTLDEEPSWNFQSHSLIPMAYMVGDIMLMRSAPGSRFIIENARDIGAILPEMARLAHAGLNNCLMHEGQLIAQCSREGHAIYNTITDGITSLAWVMALAEPHSPPVKSAWQFHQQNQTALLKSIPITRDLYLSLSQCASETLVPASDQSRKGAGA